MNLTGRDPSIRPDPPPTGGLSDSGRSRPSVLKRGFPDGRTVRNATNATNPTIRADPWKGRDTIRAVHPDDGPQDADSATNGTQGDAGSEPAESGERPVLRDARGRLMPTGRGSGGLNPRGRTRGSGARPVFSRLVRDRSRAENLPVEEAVWLVYRAVLKAALSGDMVAAKILLDWLCTRDDAAAAAAHVEVNVAVPGHAPPLTPVQLGEYVELAARLRGMPAPPPELTNGHAADGAGS